MDYLELALKAWREGETLRRRRRRAKDYTYGRQWADMVDDGNGTPVSEEALARQSGFRPHTNNLIRQLVKCVVGNFRQAIVANGSSDTVSLPPEIVDRNSLTELDCRMLEEFLISGCAVQRVVTECRMAGNGVWVDNVSPESFFVNRFTDPRGLDIELVGMLHSMSLREVLMRFAPSGGERARHITRQYAAHGGAGEGYSRLGDACARSFLEAGDGRCRVIELWTLESRSVIRCHDHASGAFFLASPHEQDRLSREADERKAAGGPLLETRPVTTLRWRCRFLSPWGEVLEEYDSPYAHGMHPFVVKFYPLIDGEVHSLVEDIIDQQRTVNRLITLIDHIMSVSAKGALLVPVESLAPGMDVSDVGQLWAKCNSVIPYRAGKGEMRQVVSGGGDAGAYRLLDLQMDMFRQISGVSGALQGQITNAHTSAALFDAQVQHSAVAILDLLQSFNSFREARNVIASKC